MTDAADRFTFPARVAVVEAQARAEARNSYRVAPAHLLAALAGVLTCRTVADRSMAEPPDRGVAVLAALGLGDTPLEERLGRDLDDGSTNGDASGRRSRLRLGRRTPPMDQQLRQILGDALRASLERHDEHVGTEHLLMALARAGSPYTAELAVYGITSQRLSETLDAEDGPRRAGTAEQSN